MNNKVKTVLTAVVLAGTILLYIFLIIPSGADLRSDADRYGPDLSITIMLIVMNGGPLIGVIGLLYYIWGLRNEKT